MMLHSKLMRIGQVRVILTSPLNTRPIDNGTYIHTKLPIPCAAFYGPGPKIKITKYY